MILWKDFILDDVVGPSLSIEGEDQISVSRGAKAQRCGSPSIMEDAKVAAIQETGQEIEPARMVGLSGSESITQSADIGMDADSGNRVFERRQRGEG